MEAQMQQQRLEHENAGLHSGEPGEKKSVMKKVKDKAKKIKDAFKKQSPNTQGQENEYTYDESPDKEDDDADEEIANDREIHGAPMHDSNVISSSTDKMPMQLDHNPEKPTHTHEDRYDPMVKGEAKARPNIPVQTGIEQEMPSENKHFPSPTKPFSVQGEEASSGEPEVKLGPSMGLENDPHSPKISPGECPVPPSNYESNKVSDPAGDGGKEAGISPLIRRFDNLNVGDESETKPEPKQGAYTGRHDQFNPESNPVRNLDNNPESDHEKTFDSNKTEDMPRDTVAGKVSSTVSDKANVVASKLGYGTGSGHERTSPESETTPGYTQKIAETLNPVYEKVAGAGTAVLSKFQGGGEPAAAASDTGTEKGGYLAEKLKPGEEDKALSEAITEGYLQKTGQEKKPMGKVNESDEVVPHPEDTGLESKKKGEDEDAVGRESSGPGVVGRVKNVVGSWIGMGTGTQNAQDSSVNGSTGQGDGVAGEQPRL